VLSAEGGGSDLLRDPARASSSSAEASQSLHTPRYKNKQKMNIKSIEQTKH
jgi:hypothetical protein